MTKKLATIRQVNSVTDMEGFDNVYMAHIDGWQAIVKKSEVKKDDIVVFIEPGALCPNNETFNFLEKRKFKVKTMKMKGYLSQGLLMPLSILKNTDFKIPEDNLTTSILGTDVTSYLGLKDFTEQVEVVNIEKHNKPFVNFLLKHYLTRWIGKLFLPKKTSLAFPTHLVSKTDEERIQNCPKLLKVKGNWKIREKVDGMSGTWIVERKKTWYGRTYFEFYCCSRNFRLNEKYDKSKPQFLLAEKYKIKELLTQYIMDSDCKYACLQGECIGEKIQGNPYKIKGYDLYLFNMIVDNKRLDCHTVIKILDSIQTIHHLPETKFAPLVDYKSMHEELPFGDKTVNEVLEYANGKSRINKDVIREGVVVREYEKNLSFKVVSPDYLIKKGE